MKKNKTKNIAGVTLIEMLIGVAVTALMMGAMFSTYSVVKNSFNQVNDRAKISRAARDIVGMMVKDIRLAGFKYYYGENIDAIATSEDLTHLSGLEEGRDIIDSHDPLIVIKDKLGYFAADQILDDEDTPKVVKHHGIVCCDRIHIVYGDFDKNDPLQKYKKYRVTYYAMPMQNNENDKFYGVYKTKESWIENPDSPKGQWVSSCSECYTSQLVRSHLVDMEFLLFDAHGQHLFNPETKTYPQPDNSSSVDLYRIKQVDMRLTFRSKKDFYRSDSLTVGGEKKLRIVQGLGTDRHEEYQDKYLRDSVVVSIHTRNIGGY